MVSQIKVNEIIKQSGSSITIGESGDTIDLSNPTSVTLNSTMENTPMWYAKSDANQTGIATATQTKITYGTEVIDTDSAFASSKFTVPSGAAGKYFITGTITWLSGAWTSQQILYIYKNGSNAYAEFRYKDATDMGMTVSAVLDLAVSDYIEIYAYQPSGSSRDTWSSPYTFYGYKLLG